MKRLIALLCTTVVLSPARQAIAFCYVPQPRLVCAEYFASQLVIEGTLVKALTLGDRKNPEYFSAKVYTLRVNKVFRGKSTASVRVYDGNDSGRATFDWNQGEKYLLFLTYQPREKAWALDNCGNSGPVSAVAAATTEILAIQKAHSGGVILGVASRDLISTPFPGALIEAQGSGKRYLTTANQNGAFEFDVPSGLYRIRAAAAGFSFQKADISYESPEHLRIQPGGCAQVQLVAEQTPK